jgi:hypothetical protein
MKKLQFMLMLGCIIFSTQSTEAQVLGWEMDGNTGNEISVSSTTTDSNLEISEITRGIGLNASTLSNSFSSNNFSSASLVAAIAENEYIQFRVSPKAGYKASLNTLDSNFRRSGTGPSDFQWQYSLDAFQTSGTNIGMLINYTSTATNGNSQNQIDLSVISALQNVSFPNSVTFRLYGWNASTTGGTFALGRLAGEDLKINGITTPVTTAIEGEISGRTRTKQGRGIKHIVIMLSGGDLPEPLYATTNQFGNYQFENLPVGEIYVLQALSSRHRLENSSRVINLLDNIFNEDFIVTTVTESKKYSANKMKIR